MFVYKMSYFVIDILSFCQNQNALYKQFGKDATNKCDAQTLWKLLYFNANCSNGCRKEANNNPRLLISEVELQFEKF